MPEQVICPAQGALVDGDGPRCTYMNETKSETNPPAAACGERQVPTT